MYADPSHPNAKHAANIYALHSYAQQSNKLAVSLLCKGSLPECFVIFKRLESLIMATKRESPHGHPILAESTATIYNNIGCYFFRKQKLSEALYYLTKARQFQNQALISKIDKAVVDLNISATYLSLTKCDLASQHASTAVKLVVLAQKELLDSMQDSKLVTKNSQVVISLEGTISSSLSAACLHALGTVCHGSCLKANQHYKEALVAYQNAHKLLLPQDSRSFIAGQILSYIASMKDKLKVKENAFTARDIAVRSLRRLSTRKNPAVLLKVFPTVRAPQPSPLKDLHHPIIISGRKSSRDVRNVTPVNDQTSRGLLSVEPTLINSDTYLKTDGDEPSSALADTKELGLCKTTPTTIANIVASSTGVMTSLQRLSPAQIRFLSKDRLDREKLLVRRSLTMTPKITNTNPKKETLQDLDTSSKDFTEFISLNSFLAKSSAHATTKRITLQPQSCHCRTNRRNLAKPSHTPSKFRPITKESSLDSPPSTAATTTTTAVSASPVTEAPSNAVVNSIAARLNLLQSSLNSFSTITEEARAFLQQDSECYDII